MQDDKDNKNSKAKRKGADLIYLRGYCRVCNRHYFYRNKLDTGHLQFRQHHGGICQNCNYACATINSRKSL